MNDIEKTKGEMVKNLKLKSVLSPFEIQVTSFKKYNSEVVYIKIAKFQ